MNAAQLHKVAKPPAVEPLIVTLALSDPEVLHALKDYPDGPARNQFLVTALKVGVLSLKAAHGSLDSDTLRREGDRLLDELSNRLDSWRSGFEERVSGSLAHYFDPQQGAFTERVNRLTKADGDLVAVMRQQTNEAQAGFAKVLELFVGENSQLLRMLDPSGENQLVSALHGTLAEIVQAQNQAILGQFSLDNKDGALVRFLQELGAKHGDLNQALARDLQAVTGEFSLDKEDSALSRLVARVEAAQRSLNAQLSLDHEDSSLRRLHRMLQEHQAAVLKQQLELSARLDSAIQSMSARRDEAAKSTRHGLVFEQALHEHLDRISRAAGDILQHTGATTGLIPNCKVGDYLIMLGPDKTAAGARIVIEAKENASYDLAKTLEEADLARRNRQANVCVFVHSTASASAGIPKFQRYGRDLIVQWDVANGEHDVWLEAALMVANALSTKAARHDKQDAASFDRIDKAIERIRKLIESFDEINTCANTARSSAEKILHRARLIHDGLSSQAQSIIDEMLKLKRAADRA